MLTNVKLNATVKARVKNVKVRVGTSGRVWAMTPSSKGGSGSWYELTVDKKNRVQCECMSYRFSSVKKEDKSCKHMLAAHEQEVWRKVKSNKAQSVRREEAKSCAGGAR